MTVWPDSFVQRGRPKGVCTDPSPPRVTPEMRADDARSALAYVRSLPFVDAKRVAVMGGSHGGNTTLATIVEAPGYSGEAKAGFVAAIALYPNCNRSFGGWHVTREDRGGNPSFMYSGVFKPVAPLLILIGELDDWTPAAPCRKLAEAAAAAGHPVEIKVYPGAHHSFDSIAPVRMMPERINRNVAGGRGATTGGNPAAWADAVIQVERFLQTYLKKRE